LEGKMVRIRQVYHLAMFVPVFLINDINRIVGTNEICPRFVIGKNRKPAAINAAIRIVHRYRCGRCNRCIVAGNNGTYRKPQPHARKSHPHRANLKLATRKNGSLLTQTAGSYISYKIPTSSRPGKSQSGNHRLSPYRTWSISGILMRTERRIWSGLL